MAAVGRNLRGALLALGAFAVFSSHDAAIKALGASYHAAQIVFFSALLGLPAALFNFLIVAWAVFLLVKAVNRLRDAATPPAPAPTAPRGPTSEDLLAEIRDLLRARG